MPIVLNHELAPVDSLEVNLRSIGVLLGIYPIPALLNTQSSSVHADFSLFSFGRIKI